MRHLALFLLFSTTALAAEVVPGTAAAPAAQPAQPAEINTADAAPKATVAVAPAGPKVTYTACHVDGPYVALTFDDGPHATNTPRLLDMLKERGMKGTFFVVGQCAAEYPQIMKRIVEEGHEVASHSWSHPNLSTMSEAGVREQLRKTHEVITRTAGVEPKVMRPPYGAFTERQRRWSHGEFGYKCILWDVDTLDWKHRNAARVTGEIMQQTRPGSIILTHDIHKSTIDAMPSTLDGLKAKGFKLVTVSELLAMDKPTTRPKPATPEPAESTKTSSLPPGATPAPAGPVADATPKPAAKKRTTPATSAGAPASAAAAAAR